MSWRLAKALITLRAQVDAAHPGRAKPNDGSIGDTAHQARVSDHNPNKAGVVQAIDISHDPAHGFDSYAFAELLRQKRDNRIKYVISHGVIFSSLVHPWEWRKYTGADGHFHHVHISVSDDPHRYDDDRKWDIDAAAPPAPPTEPPPSINIAPGDNSSRSGPNNAILDIANKSEIMHYIWHQRGKAPPAYIQGMALAFAQTYRRFRAQHPAALEMAKANTHNDTHDALSWYNSNFRALGMDNELAGADTLRHLFVLMLGVGMRESSGKHCCGRDRSASNMSADTAEAGLFQTSYNAHVCHPTFDQVMDEFLAGKANGYLPVFSHGVSCGGLDWANAGAGRGFAFQDLCKKQPAFAAESCAITLRNLRHHYGTVNRKEAEIRKEADDMFLEIEKAIA